MITKELKFERQKLRNSLMPQGLALFPPNQTVLQIFLICGKGQMVTGQSPMVLGNLSVGNERYWNEQSAGRQKTHLGQQDYWTFEGKERLDQGQCLLPGRTARTLRLLRRAGDIAS